MNTFMDALINNEKSYTANGGTAYRTSGSPLVDLNFSVPALRQAAVDFYGKSKHDRYFYGAHRTMDAVDASRTGEVVEFTPEWTDTDPKVIVKEVIAKVVEGVDITKADILVGAGRGAEACLDMVQAVAEELGGELCASRAVVDEGFAGKAIQVGQTGKNVRPSLYIG